MPYSLMRRTQRYSVLLWMLTLLFAGRVLGQALQYWLPLSFLPSFNAFQGSTLPYWLLLSIQLLILATMIRTSWHTQKKALSLNPRLGKNMQWLGGIYMAGSLARLLIGLLVPDAPAWFSTWIPAAFHLVLAAFVLIVATLHINGRPKVKAESDEKPCYD